MATKRKSKNKRYPVQREVEMRSIANDANKVIDVPKVLSMLNHRLYRQSRVYRTKVNLMNKTAVNNTHPNGFTIEVFALRDTWMLQKAYQFAKETYDKTVEEERARLSNNQMARWSDFRIVTDISSGNTEMLPMINRNNNLAASSLNVGEHVPTEVFDEAGNGRAFGLWSSSTRYSIIDEYDSTSNTGDDPDTTIHPSRLAYAELDDEAQGDQMQRLQETGDQPPYNATALEGDSPFRKVGEIGFKGANGFLVSSTGFFDAPLGIIYLRYLDSTGGEAGQANFHVELEVASGDYKGVHAVNYLE